MEEQLEQLRREREICMIVGEMNRVIYRDDLDALIHKGQAVVDQAETNAEWNALDTALYNGVRIGTNRVNAHAEQVRYRFCLNPFMAY
jgi:hypothetical protein